MSGEQTSGPRQDAGLIHALLDQLASDFGAPPFREQIAAARQEYFARAGKVFEDDAEVYEALTVHPSASVAVIVKLKVPPAVGAPESEPLEARVRPGGREPPVMVKV